MKQMDAITDAHMKQMDAIIAKMTDTTKKKEAAAALRKAA
jgi:hypothetical protein